MGAAKGDVHMKKLLVVLISTLMALLMCCAGAEETDEPTVYTSGEWKYVLLEDGTAEIYCYFGPDDELAIPGIIDGNTVTAIGNSAFSISAMKSVTIPDSITTIGTNPFAYCRKLTNIIVSRDHPTLATIDGVLFDKTEKRLICYPCAFMDTSYVIPQDIQIIGDYAFNNCEFLTSVTLPDSVTAIGDYAFSGCRLTSITLPDSVITIGTNPFTDCVKLTDIIVSPDHPMLASINGVLFDKVEKKLICYPYAYKNRSYTVPQGILVIGDDAFYGCRLTDVRIPDTVTAIGDSAFCGCRFLRSITLPDSITTIGNSAFYRCRLTDVTIPDSVTTIGDGAFESTTIITVPRDSYAAQWCKENGLNYTYPDALDWLND